MMKKYYLIIITIVLFLTISSYVLSVLPPGITVFCHTNRSFLIENNIPLNNTYGYNIAKDNMPFKLYVDIETEETGFLIFTPAGGFDNETYAYYDGTIINDTKFFLLSNFCKEDIKPILNLLKQRNISYYSCDFETYSKTTEDTDRDLGLYTERLDNWLMICKNLDFVPNLIPITSSLSIILIILVPIALLVIISLIIIIFLRKKKSMKKK